MQSEAQTVQVEGIEHEIVVGGHLFETFGGKRDTGIHRAGRV
jgi:hypothetical protein